jgi:iron(III) transport system ATP-binding protein
MLKLQNVSIKLDNRQIINDISFDLGEGKVLSIVGESGVGKTTLLRSVAGLVDVEGAIIFDGNEVIGPSERLVPGVDGIATVFQDYQLMHNRTVYENISYPLRAYVEEEQRSHTEELLKVLMLDTHKDHYPQELSGGQKQRVAIARALADEPSLLLMDEPFSNMDVALREVVKSSVFSYLKQEGITTILVTHDPKDALAISDQIAVIQSGEIGQLAAPKMIYEQPVDQYVMSCFGHCNYWSKKAFELDFTVNIADHINKVAIRVGDLIAIGNGESDCEVQVLESVYQGSDHLIKSISKSNNFVYFYSKDSFDVEQIISLKVSAPKIQYFQEI